VKRGLLLVAALAFGLWTAVALAARPSISVTPRIVQQGQSVRIQGSADGCRQGSVVTVISRAFVHTHEFAGVSALFVRVGAGGRFHAVTAIPLTRRPGAYTVTARCGGGNLGVAAVLRVTAKPSLAVAPSTVRAGGSVTISGSAADCPVGDTVTVLSHAFVHTHDFAGVPAVLTPVRTGGSFRTTTTIPNSRKAGRYIVTARCGGGNLGVAAYVTVTS